MQFDHAQAWTAASEILVDLQGVAFAACIAVLAWEAWKPRYEWVVFLRLLSVAFVQGLYARVALDLNCEPAVVMAVIAAFLIVAGAFTRAATGAGADRGFRWKWNAAAIVAVLFGWILFRACLPSH